MAAYDGWSGDGSRQDPVGQIPRAHGGADQTGAFTGFARIAGALISIGLIIGLGVWSYETLTRDVSGVPVVRALEGPMRVQPDDPGGIAADHQGLAVNVVAGSGAAAPPPDRLVLAPRPVDLAEEDLPAPKLRDLATRPQARGSDSTRNARLDQMAAAAQAEADARDGDGDRIELPAPLDMAALAPTDTRDDAEAAELGPQPVPARVAARDTGDGLPRSLRPQVRPEDIQARVVLASVEVQPRVDDIDVAPQNVPIGTSLAQLGAFGSEDIARGEWERLNARFGDYLTGKQRVIERASSGGRIFYRLRAMGFDDLSDARRFCSAFVAEGTDCVPLVVR